MIFICSDIHGNYEVYRKAVDKISANDTLYILGDVIDRGPDGIVIIQDMMLRDNVRFLLGNHEWMLLTTVLSNWDQDYTGIWSNPSNGGNVTIKYLRSLPIEEINLITNWLKEKPLYEKIHIGEKTINLVHGMYDVRLNGLSGTSFVKILKEHDNGEAYEGALVFDPLWDSPFKGDIMLGYKPDEIYIHGHVPVLRFSNILQPFKYQNVIAIDGGLMYGGGLILYNLSDDTFEIIK